MSEIHGATGSYVVDALDPDELDEFEAHLAVCPTCRHEIVEFCETAAELSLLSDAPPPPLTLRDSILGGIAEVRPLPPLEVAPRRAFPTSLTFVDDVEEKPAGPAAFAPVVVASDPVVVDELAARRGHRRTRVLSLLVAAVTVVALALGGVVVSLVQGQQAPTAAAPVADASLLSAPDAKIVAKTLPSGAHVSFVVSKQQNRAMLVSTDLPSAGAGKAYQLWTLKGGSATPDNLLNGGASVSQWFHGPVNDSTGLAITIEPAGGSAQPTTTPTAIDI